MGLSAAAQAAQPCRATTRATVTPETPFRCDLALTAGRPVLVRVEQAQVDVTLELLDSSKRSLVKVDSPTRRAGPELLLASAPASATRTLVVASLGKGTVPISLSEPPAAETRGLALLTSSAAAAVAETQQREADLRNALAELRKARAARHEAEALSRIAATDYWVRGDWVAAAASAQQAMSAWEKLGDEVMWSQSSVIRAASLIETAQETQRTHGRGARASGSQFDEAEKLLSTAAGHFRVAGRSYDEARALNNQGHPSFYRGRNDEARALYVRAAAIFRELGDRVSEIMPLQNIAVLDFDRGDYAHALESYERLLSRLPADRDPIDRVSLLNNLAVVYEVLGEADKALRAHLAALDIAEPSRFVQDRARTLHGLGNLYLRLGEIERGGEFLREALTMRRAIQPADRRGLHASLIAVGEWHRERGELAEALKLHVEAMEHAVSLAQKARTHLVIGRVHAESGSLEQARATYERGLELDLPDAWPIRASLKSAYGETKLRSGDPIGYALITSAAATHRAHGNDELAAQDHLKLAQFDMHLNRTDQALRNVGAALALFDRRRASAMNPDLRATYVADRAAAYELQAEIYMTLAERASSAGERQRLQLTALATVVTRRARALEDFERIAEPEALEIDRDLRARHHRIAVLLDQQEPQMDKVEALRKEIALLNARLDLLHARSPTVAPGAVVSPASIDDYRVSLPDHSVTLAYLLGDRRSWLWAITREKVLTFALAGRNEIEEAARELQELWSRPLAQKDDREREEAASRAIIGPAASALSGRRSVEVIADGELRRVPFAALRIAGQSDAGTQRLGQSHSVAMLPSLAFIAATESRTRNDKRILLIGDAIAAPRQRGLELDTGTFRALPGARREIALISEVATTWQANTLTGVRATKPALLDSRLATYSVLHFATHARADVANPQLSALMLSPSAQGSGDAFLSLREIVALRLNADMVVLSACESALGKQYRGQLSFGLSEAFLLGGARTVVGSLWRVSDAATQRYMTLFYDLYLNRAMAPAVAAQRAARVMMNDPKYAHPFYWAAFVVLTSRTPTKGGAV